MPEGIERQKGTVKYMRNLDVARAYLVVNGLGNADTKQDSKMPKEQLDQLRAAVQAERSLRRKGSNPLVRNY